MKDGKHYTCIDMINCYADNSGVCDGKHKNWLTTLLLAIFLGVIGVHRFYVNKIGTGIIMLLLCWTGISAIWAIVDIIMIALGKFEDAEGRILIKDS